MSDPLALLSVFLIAAAICWWALIAAYRTDEIYYRGDTCNRKKNPFFFWATVVLCVMFGVIAPISYIAKQGPAIIQSVQENLK
ncbi:hypothetical protein E3U23_13575 [Erythrobacter litoralis]|uniref:hypothetical protein n=1 Tax=Erythrobacter litoralis TaxID=39960 RepID=UPI00243579F2|nr:hypothetical protein [Erythrobacter litoralis]MDG6080220.1 hypothetical protein [Erythrobacter litoralis]